MSDIGILGAGTWGIALARMLANSGHKVTVWSAIESEIVTLKTLGVHPKLPGVKLPSSIEYSTNISDACVKCEFIIFAVPSVFLRQTVSDASNYLTNDQIVITVVKGIETQTNFTMSEVISDELSKKSTLDYNIVALSGPTHAEEVGINGLLPLFTSAIVYGTTGKILSTMINKKNTLQIKWYRIAFLFS